MAKESNYLQQIADKIIVHIIWTIILAIGKQINFI